MRGACAHWVKLEPDQTWLSGAAMALRQRYDVAAMALRRRCDGAAMALRRRYDVAAMALRWRCDVVWKAAQTAGQGLRRGKTVACAACSAQNLPHRERGSSSIDYRNTCSEYSH